MPLQTYLKELKKITLLEPEEEQCLWFSYKAQGDLASRQRLIEQYQPLVFKAAAHWRSNEAKMMDIIQEGTVGLIEAVENYDPSRKVAFSLFALHRIRGRMLTYIQKEGRHDHVYMDSPLSAEEGQRTLADCLVDAEADVSRQVEQNLLLQQVQQALQRLPVKEQEVLNGVYLQDCEARQMADALDISISHLYRLQRQGIRRIRGMLSRFMQNR
ncbi:MAG: polymerase, sigma 28 subunit, FliA/WhiG subfamily [Firmicutes bacterium]|nr:polymerase, sigma 28 subunit, FliA/WhiG subfamily [Bacillota bacterium]